MGAHAREPQARPAVASSTSPSPARHRASSSLGFVSVGREGIETALFVWASVNSSGDAGASARSAPLLGILTAVVIAYLIYRGLVRINLVALLHLDRAVPHPRRRRRALAYGVGDLQEAGVIPGWGQPAFSLAGAIPPSSWYGTLLGGLFNFTPEPDLGAVHRLARCTSSIVTALFLRQVSPARPRRHRGPGHDARPHSDRLADTAGSTARPEPISQQHVHHRRPSMQHRCLAGLAGAGVARPRPHRLRAEQRRRLPPRSPSPSPTTPATCRDATAAAGAVTFSLTQHRHRRQRVRDPRRRTSCASSARRRT